MISFDELKREFENRGGIMKRSELDAIGLNSRQILRLVNENVLSKLKIGIYELTEFPASEEVIIAKTFPTAVIYLESALLYYGYTDRIPSTWQIAVDKNISKQQLKISYPSIKPFYIDPKYLEIGIDTFEVNKVKIRIYDKERTICDVLRYANKLDNEVFNNAIQRYVRDNNRNIKRLMEYAKILRVSSKVKIYIGVWL